MARNSRKPARGKGLVAAAAAFAASPQGRKLIAQAKEYASRPETKERAAQLVAQVRARTAASRSRTTPSKPVVVTDDPKYGTPPPR
jgi:hypothetical protein